AGTRAADDTHDAVASNAGADLETQFTEPSRHAARGPLLAAGDFPVLMKVTAERDERRLDVTQAPLGAGEKGVRARLAGGTQDEDDKKNRCDHVAIGYRN